MVAKFQKNINFSAFILASSFLLSSFLGLIRDRLMANRFGISKDLDIYFTAFRIPDLVYGILMVSGFSSVFLPLLSDYFREGKEKGWRFANVILNSFLILLILLSLIMFIFTPFLITIIAPGFDQFQKDKVVFLTRIMLLSPIFFGISSIFSSILHYFERFLVYSLAPILYNLGIIFGIIFLSPYWGIVGLGLGVIFGSLLHLLIQIPSVFKCGYRYFFVIDFKFSGLLKIFNFMSWRLLGGLVPQLNLIIVTAIASKLSLGSISVFNFSNNISRFVTNIIGVSLATATFPTLSRFWSEGKKDSFLNTFSSSFKKTLFASLFLSFLIFLMRDYIVKIILKGGLFGDEETKITSAALGFFSFGVFAFSLVPLLLRSFFALKDFRTPTLIGFTYMILVLITSIFFVEVLASENIFKDFVLKLLSVHDVEEIRVIGLSLAFSVSGVFYFLLLYFFLRRKLKKE